MARNSEKAMTTLARWRAAHLDKVKEKERRPYLATECDDLQKAEKFRRQIIGEVSRKVAQIQNAGLGEFKLRDLNDEINKLLREKRHWNDRIIDLGGPNYHIVGPKMLDSEGKEVPGTHGYKYFGATKDLPGVRELFGQETAKPARKTRGELMKEVDADYYGYRDEDDGVIVPLEEQDDKNYQKQCIEEWKKKQATRSTQKQESTSTTTDTQDEDIYDVHEPVDSDEEELHTRELILDQHTQFIAHVPVPTQQQVEEALLMRKKQELMQKYVSEDLQAEESNVKDMLGV